MESCKYASICFFIFQSVLLLRGVRCSVCCVGVSFFCISCFNLFICSLHSAIACFIVCNPSSCSIVCVCFLCLGSVAAVVVVVVVLHFDFVFDFDFDSVLGLNMMVAFLFVFVFVFVWVC